MPRIKVIDRSGQPVPGATIEIVDAWVPVTDLPLPETDPSGISTFVNFPSPWFTFRARGPRGTVGEVTIGARNVNDTAIVIRLEGE